MAAKKRPRKPPAKPPAPEKKVKAQIKAAMAERFPDAWGYMPVQTGMGEHGIPDHIYCVPVTITEEMVGAEVGLFVAIEAKTLNGTTSRYQDHQLRAIQDAAGIAEVVYGAKEESRSIDSAINNIEMMLEEF